ncbi:MAG: peptide chain release factor N(5)-glutamine methyltransferase [Acidimicrobiales bacterium]
MVGAGRAATWRDLVASATKRLAAADVEVADARQEARWLAEQASGLDVAELQLELDRPVPARASASFDRMLDRRLAGEPLQYALGRWGFRRLDLYVDHRVLIPRPETEVLAERALAECDHLGATTVVDLGTGSGALALSLAVERPQLHEIWATDVSGDALAVARANLAGLGAAASRVRLASGSWFAALPEGLRRRIDVVVSNPPYVADSEMPDLPDEVRDWEPVEALVSGSQGLDAIAEIVADAPGWLTRPGALLVEMAPHQTARAERLARAAGFTSVSVWPDLAGRDRILCARL